MAILKEYFLSDKLSNDDFDCLQIKFLGRTDMTNLESRIPKILRTSLQSGAIIVHYEDEGTG